MAASSTFCDTINNLVKIFKFVSKLVSVVTHSSLTKNPNSDDSLSDWRHRFPSKNKKVVAVQCPYGACTAAFQEAKGCCCHDVLLSLSSNPVYLGVVVARCVIDGDAIKAYQGPLICGLPFAAPLLLKGTATPNNLINILYLA